MITQTTTPQQQIANALNQTMFEFIFKPRGKKTVFSVWKTYSQFLNEYPGATIIRQEI